jgi:hypothetical protein
LAALSSVGPSHQRKRVRLSLMPSQKFDARQSSNHFNKKKRHLDWLHRRSVASPEGFRRTASKKRSGSFENGRVRGPKEWHQSLHRAPKSSTSAIPASTALLHFLGFQTRARLAAAAPPPGHSHHTRLRIGMGRELLLTRLQPQNRVPSKAGLQHIAAGGRTPQATRLVTACDLPETVTRLRVAMLGLRKKETSAP